jgi:hypothetical protein
MRVTISDVIGQRISAVVKQFHGKFTWQYFEPEGGRPPMYFVKRDDCETKWQISEFVLWDLMEPRHETWSKLYAELEIIRDMPLDRLSEVPDLL